jgi:membrane protein implicated in regulation of membrane protease activity
MNWSNVFLICFAVGAVWSFVGLFLGSLHLWHFHGGHLHAGHGHVHAQGGHLHAGDSHGAVKTVGSESSTNGIEGHLLSMANPSALAAFLTWFGGVGYLLGKYSGWAFWLNLVLAIAVGCTGAWILGSFLRFLRSRESVLDPADGDFVGIFGQVAAPIRPDGVGELIYSRDGTRRALPAKSEDGDGIERGQEVIVTRFEKGIAYVRTWEAMTRELR